LFVLQLKFELTAAQVYKNFAIYDIFVPCFSSFACFQTDSLWFWS
jgi:hypothetical protein